MRIGTSGILFLAMAGGCGGNAQYLTRERLNEGLVIILPGIEGESSHNRNIRRGLLAAGLRRAMPIHAWGRPIPLAGMILNQMDVIGNRFAAAGIARMIVQYQDKHPGRPVHIVGHSGGGGVAVFAAEAMPPGRRIDGLVLLSPSLSGSYDLTKALRCSRNGIVNFHSRSDVGLLVIGTTLAGNVDGGHGPAAGALGFDMPRSGDSEDKKSAYFKLYQVEITRQMLDEGAGAHLAATRSDFVHQYVAPWVRASNWPVEETRQILAHRGVISE